MQRRSISIIIIILLLLIGGVVYLNRQANNDQILAVSGTTMGTSYHIKLAPQTEKQPNLVSLKEKIDARLNDIDAKMSTYKDNSEVSRFNRYLGDDWVSISPETLSVINTAQEISRLSNGAFDITVGKLVNLWGFGPTVRVAALPAINTIETLLSQVGYYKLELRQTPPAIRKSDRNIYLDLSAIAKGYAVDAIAHLLLENQIENFLVEIGGEIITHGEKYQHQPWVIGIESPVAQQRSIRKKLLLEDVAMATSGDYRNYFEENGVRYSHTIDPTTGYPIKHQLASVTVIDSTCQRADALATAIMVMGPSRGLEFARQQQLAIFMLVKQGDHFMERYSAAFKPYLKPEED